MKAHLLSYLVGVWKKQVSRKTLGRDTTSSCESSSLCRGTEKGDGRRRQCRAAALPAAHGRWETQRTETQQETRSRCTESWRVSSNAARWEKRAQGGRALWLCRTERTAKCPLQMAVLGTGDIYICFSQMEYLYQIGTQKLKIKMCSLLFLCPCRCRQ